MRRGVCWEHRADQFQTTLPPQLTPLRTTAQEVCVLGCTDADAVLVQNTVLFGICCEQECLACLLLHRGLGLRLTCVEEGDANTSLKVCVLYFMHAYGYVSPPCHNGPLCGGCVGVLTHGPFVCACVVVCFDRWVCEHVVFLCLRQLLGPVAITG